MHTYSNDNTNTQIILTNEVNTKKNELNELDKLLSIAASMKSKRSPIFIHNNNTVVAPVGGKKRKNKRTTKKRKH